MLLRGDMTKRAEKWPIIGWWCLQFADDDIIRRGLDIVTDKKKNKPKAEQETTQPTAARFNYECIDNANKMQIEQRWVIPQTTFRAKKLETKSTTRKQENLKNGHSIVRFCLNIDVRKEKGDSWRNAIKTNIAFVQGQLIISSKSATAADNVQRITILP